MRSDAVRNALALSVALLALHPPLSRAQQRPAAKGRAAAATAPGRRLPVAPRPRYVRQDIPLGPMIRRAFAAGTRDSSGKPGRNYWQNRADYVIDATLDTATATVRGRERVTYVNNSPNEIASLSIRLLQNMFLPGSVRNDYVTDITTGTIVDTITVDGVRMFFDTRDAFDPNATLQTIALGHPFAAGSTHVITMSFRTAIPNVPRDRRGERMGRFDKDLFQVAQWYPQLAMYDDLRGWANDPYLGASEFYNEFGSFEVNIAVPAGWLVGATGALQNPEQVLSQQTRDRLALAMRADTTIHIVTTAERGAGVGKATLAGPGNLTWRFKASLVNDFAFAASRSYVYDATHANAPERVAVHTLYLPDNDYSKTSAYGKFALEFYSRILMPYDFPQLTIADGPETGMEYPMILFNGSGFGVTSHETGHEWFPMMVGSNETWYGFMDEGFNSYFNSVAAVEFNKTPIDRAAYGASYRRIAGSELEAPMMWPADFAGPNYGVQTYNKAPVALWALGAIVGDSTVQRAMSAYARAWKYKHPSPWDFYFFMNNEIGQDLGWFWNSWFFTTQTFDQALEKGSVRSGTWSATVVDKGDMAMPVIARVTFADSTSATLTRPASTWFSGTRRIALSYKVPPRKRLVRVTLDPENRFHDLDRSNNTWEADTH